MKVLKLLNECALINIIFNREENVNMIVYDIGVLHQHRYEFGRMGAQDIKRKRYKIS